MWIRRFKQMFGGDKNTHFADEREVIQETAAPTPQFNRSTDSLKQFQSRISHLSNPDYPFLHPTYSPGSRVPCADFTRFIVERLKTEDVIAIHELMGAVIAANPGVGVGTGWVKESVDEIVGIDFCRYCRAAGTDFPYELAALFILGSKDGGGRQFWIADDKPLLFALALCCHDIQWLDTMAQLRERANRFIRDMRTNTPFWKQYPLFNEYLDELSPIDDPVAVSAIAALPPLCRVHVLSIAKNGVAALLNSTTYQMRNLGINPLETGPILLASDICEPYFDCDSLATLVSKNDLIATLERHNIPYRKSWKKSQLLDALDTHKPAVLDELAERDQLVRIGPQFLPALQALRSRALLLQEQIKLLCFASS